MGYAGVLQPLSARTLGEQTADQLRAFIASGELRAGTRLVESEVAQALHVSRGPVREAFKQLRDEGLLREVARRGTFVRSLSPDDVRDLMDLRAGLEARAARLVAEGRGPQAWPALEAAVEQIASACRSGERSQISAADYAFHESVCLASGSPRLHEVFVRYVAELRILLRSDEERLHRTGVDIPGQHAQLLQILRAGEPGRAQDAFREHVEATRERLLAALSTSVAKTAR